MEGTRIYINIYIQDSIFIHIYSHTHIHVNVNIYIYMYIHIYIHTHTYMCTYKSIIMSIQIYICIPCLREACLELSGPILSPGLGDGFRKLVSSSLGVFSGLGSEMAPGSLFLFLWGHFLAWAPQYLQEANWSSLKPFSVLGSLFGAL